MTRFNGAFCCVFVALFGAAIPAMAYTLPELSEASKECVMCHRDEGPIIYEQWGGSMHFRANVGCYECHKAEETDPDAFDHFDRFISIIVSPRDCSKCHEKEVTEFSGSRHSKAGRIMGSLDNVLAEVVEGNRGFRTEMFPQGVSAAAVNGCWQCHGSEVKVLPDGHLDPATWPNTGIGRINPDGSEGSCTACHSRHSFSPELARQPENCGKCHMGPDHPQIEIYNESKHGIAYRAFREDMNLDSPKWIVGEDYTAAPTCATCHMSATPDMPVTHDVGMRISWNNRPVISVRPEVADAKLGLPGASVGWQERRMNMQSVCMNCHSQNYVENFYQQYDALLELYHEKFAKPGLVLMAAAKPLMRPVKFGNKLDWIWFELWHHEGRRARHGASMMGPDITHWHGTYEVAKKFYSELIPELEELVEDALRSTDAEKRAAGEHLRETIETVLNSDNHKWYVNKMDPAEAASRKARQEEFKGRYVQ